MASSLSSDTPPTSPLSLSATQPPCALFAITGLNDSKQSHSDETHRSVQIFRFYIAPQCGVKSDSSLSDIYGMFQAQRDSLLVQEHSLNQDVRLAEYMWSSMWEKAGQLSVEELVKLFTDARSSPYQPVIEALHAQNLPLTSVQSQSIQRSRDAFDVFAIAAGEQS